MISSATAMLHYYEIVVRSDGRDRVVRRVPTQRGAERMITEMIHADLVSSKAIRFERRRGLHPWSIALLCGGLSILALFVPLISIRVGLSVMLLALTLGFSTSGRRWIAGGRDDR